MASSSQIQGKWALVTGASSGIGLALARHGVRVTVLCPGATESEFFEVSRITAQVERFARPRS